MRKRFFILGILTVITITLTGCQPDIQKYLHENKNIPASQIRGGTVTISAYPAIPWDEIADDLKPNFKMDNADAALEKILPLTYSQKSERSDRTTVNVQANIGGGGSQQDEGLNNDGNKAGQNSGDASSAQNKENAGKANENPAAAGAQTGTQDKSEKPNIDPFQQYRTATALFQEVKILNDYLTSTDFICNYVPYLIRLNITVQPYAHNQPFDVYTMVRFYYNANQLEYDKQLKIIPLFQTDNLERSQNQRSLDAARQLGANISAKVSGKGLGASVQNQIQDLLDLVGSDYNSLFSIAKLDEDRGFVIRLGAGYSGSSGYSMVGRSYDATFLLLKPLDFPYKEVNVWAYSEWRNALDGKLIPMVDDAYLDELQIKVEHTMKYKGFDETRINEMKLLIKEKKIRDFCNYLFDQYIETQDTKTKNVRRDYLLMTGDPLFYEIARLSAATPTWYGLISLESPVILLPSFQTGVYSDDGTNTLNVQIAAPQNANTRNINTALIVIKKDKSRSGNLYDVKNNIKLPIDIRSNAKSDKGDIEYLFYPKKIVLNKDGNMSIDFPSVRSIDNDVGRLDFYLALAAKRDQFRACGEFTKDNLIFEKADINKDVVIYPLKPNLNTVPKTEQPDTAKGKQISQAAKKENKKEVRAPENKATKTK
jgi:hypothetical protein